MFNASSPQQRLRLAWAAVLLGGLLAAGSLWHEGRAGRLPADAVAMVGDQPIARAQWLRAVQSVESDKRVSLDAAGRRAILDRLIDEELLYQHALSSGLARDDPGLRKTLIAGLIDATTSGTGSDEDAARKLFEQDPAYFAAQPRLQVRGLEPLSAETTADLPALKAALLAGDTPQGWRALELPADAVPLPQLAQRLGGSATEALRGAPTQELLGPLGGRYLMVIARYADAPRYEDVAAAVRTELSRREAEAALARLLATLRQDSVKIRVADDL